MTEELDVVRKSLELAIKAKDRESFANALVELTLLIDTPRYARREEAFAIEESMMHEASEVGIAKTGEEIRELWDEVHDHATIQKRLVEIKKDTEKAIASNNIIRLAEIWHRIPKEDFEGEDYLVASIRNAGLFDEVVRELGNILEEEQDAEAKRAEREIRKIEREKKVETERVFRPPSRKDLLGEISDLKLAVPVIIRSPGTCEGCGRAIEGGTPFYTDKETGNIYHLKCAMYAFPDREWQY